MASTLGEKVEPEPHGLTRSQSMVAAATSLETRKPRHAFKNLLDEKEGTCVPFRVPDWLDPEGTALFLQGPNSDDDEFGDFSVFEDDDDSSGTESDYRERYMREGGENGSVSGNSDYSEFATVNRKQYKDSSDETSHGSWDSDNSSGYSSEEEEEDEDGRNDLSTHTRHRRHRPRNHPPQQHYRDHDVERSDAQLESRGDKRIARVAPRAFVHDNVRKEHGERRSKRLERAHGHHREYSSRRAHIRHSNGREGYRRGNGNDVNEVHVDRSHERQRVPVVAQESKQRHPGQLRLRKKTKQE